MLRSRGVCGHDGLRRSAHPGGKTASEAVRALEGAGADIVGTNCFMDPAHMLPMVGEMRRAVKSYVATQPVAYRCTDEVPFFPGQKGFSRQARSLPAYPTRAR